LASETWKGVVGTWLVYLLRQSTTMYFLFHYEFIL